MRALGGTRGERVPVMGASTSSRFGSALRTLLASVMMKMAWLRGQTVSSQCAAPLRARRVC